MSFFFSKKLILLPLALTLIVGLQTSCSSIYLFKKIILSENEESENLEENKNLESSNLKFVSDSQIYFKNLEKSFDYYHQNQSVISQFSALVPTSPPNS